MLNTMNGVTQAEVAFKSEVLYAYIGHDYKAQVRLREEGPNTDPPQQPSPNPQGKWHPIPFTDGNVKTALQDTPHGVLYNVTATFRVPLSAMFSDDGMMLLAELCNRLRSEYVVLRYTDGNGKQYLAGTATTPLRCTINRLQQSKPNDYCGYELVFKGTNEDMPAQL